MDKQRYDEIVYNIINKQNNKIDLTNLGLNDENIIEIADLIKTYDSVSKLIIKNSIKEKNILKYNYQFLKKSLNQEININQQKNIYFSYYFYDRIFNKITDGYNYLFDSLKDNKNLIYLKIDKIIFSNENLVYLVDLLKRNTSIQKLYFNFNSELFSDYLNVPIDNICNRNYIFYGKLSEVFNNRNNLLKFTLKGSNYFLYNHYTTILLFNSLKSNKYLYKLSLSNLPFNDEECQQFPNILNKFKYIKYFKFCCCHANKLTLNKLTLNKICDSLKNKNYLKHLILKDDYYFINSFDSISDLLTFNKNIKYLNIYNTSIYSDNVNNNPFNNKFKEAIINSNLKNLHLVGYKNLNIDYLIDILKNNNTIKYLNIAYSCNDNFYKLFDYLENNNNIVKLNIKDCTLNNKDIISLNNMIKNNKVLENLNMNYTLDIEQYYLMDSLFSLETSIDIND